MSESAYILFFLLVFSLGWICGAKFILWRIQVERRRTEAFWTGKRNKVIRRA
jgi:hypothetical protein